MLGRLRSFIAHMECYRACHFSANSKAVLSIAEINRLALYVGFALQVGVVLGDAFHSLEIFAWSFPVATRSFFHPAVTQH